MDTSKQIKDKFKYVSYINSKLQNENGINGIKRKKIVGDASKETSGKTELDTFRQKRADREEWNSRR